jgi:hypothetical protein
LFARERSNLFDRFTAVNSALSDQDGYDYQ